jgi:hypothetical protein
MRAFFVPRPHGAMDFGESFGVISVGRWWLGGEKLEPWEARFLILMIICTILTLQRSKNNS